MCTALTSTPEYPSSASSLVRNSLSSALKTPSATNFLFFDTCVAILLKDLGLLIHWDMSSTLYNLTISVAFKFTKVNTWRVMTEISQDWSRLAVTHEYHRIYKQIKSNFFTLIKLCIRIQHNHTWSSRAGSGQLAGAGWSATFLYFVSGAELRSSSCAATRPGEAVRSSLSRDWREAKLDLQL